MLLKKLKKLKQLDREAMVVGESLKSPPLVRPYTAKPILVSVNRFVKIHFEYIVQEKMKRSVIIISAKCFTEKRERVGFCAKTKEYVQTYSSYAIGVPLIFLPKGRQLEAVITDLNDFTVESTSTVNEGK